MGRSEQVTSLVLVVTAIVVCIGASRIGLGTFRSPGSGLIPFLAGVFLALFALAILIKSSLKEKSETISTPEQRDVRKVIKTITGMFAYVFLLPLLGYSITTFLLMLFFFKGIETLEWKWAIIASGIIWVVSYFVFDVWLQCQLPEGLFDLRRVMGWIL
jgi:putative tricarboxylic transport membrane protein